VSSPVSDISFSCAQRRPRNPRAKMQHSRNAVLGQFEFTFSLESSHANQCVIDMIFAAATTQSE